MSNVKSSQARAVKRNARSKAKRVAANKAKAAPKAIQQKKIRDTLRRLGLNGNMEFDKVLENATRRVKHGETGESEITSPAEMIEGLTKSAGEIFKLYSYITFVEALVQKGVIDFQLNVDVEEVSLKLMDLDTRISRLPAMLDNGMEDPVMVESMDIGTDLTNYTELLYADVVRSEVHSLVIEDTINRLAKEVEIEVEGEPRLHVLSSIAYKRLAEVATKLNETRAVEPEPAATAE